jgi:hypothetical protein
MDSQKQFLKLVEERKRKALEKKEAPLKWEQRLEASAKGLVDTNVKEDKSHKKHRRHRSSDSDSDQDAEEKKKRRRHRKHKRSKHSKKHRRGSGSESDEDNDDSGSDDSRERRSHRERNRKHHKDQPDTDDIQPLKLSAWRKEEGECSSGRDSYDVSDEGRARIKKHKKEHHHHSRHHRRPHEKSGKDGDGKSHAEKLEKGSERAVERSRTHERRSHSIEHL